PILFRVEIWFVQFNAIDKNLAVLYLDNFTGKPDQTFHKTLIRIFRIPEDNNVTAFEMPETDTLHVVVNKLINEKAFAIVQLRLHRFSVDHHRLHKEYADQNKYDDYQKNVAHQPERFEHEMSRRFFAKIAFFDIGIIVRRIRAKVVISVFVAETEHRGGKS